MPLKKSQKSLKRWTKQKWRTASGKKSSETGEVYAPAKTIKKLKAQKRAEQNLRRQTKRREPQQAKVSNTPSTDVSFAQR